MVTNSYEHVVSDVVDALSDVSTITTDDFAPLLDSVRLQPFEAGEYIHRSGETCEDLFCVLEGLVRCVYSADDENEVIKSFTKENQVTCAPYNPLSRSYPRFSIQALENSLLFVIPLGDIANLAQHNLNWSNFLTKHLMEVSQGKEALEAQQLSQTPKARYQKFITEDPELAQRLPDSQIAAFIGVTGEQLSRIKNQPDNPFS